MSTDLTTSYNMLLYEHVCGLQTCWYTCFFHITKEDPKMHVCDQHIVALLAISLHRWQEVNRIVMTVLRG